MVRKQLVQIRVSKEDKERIKRVADALYLDTSAWVRSVVMRAVERWENEQSQDDHG